jgi:hypothetical protein
MTSASVLPDDSGFKRLECRQQRARGQNVLRDGGHEDGAWEALHKDRVPWTTTTALALAAATAAAEAAAGSAACASHARFAAFS